MKMPSGGRWEVLSKLSEPTSLTRRGLGADAAALYWIPTQFPGELRAIFRHRPTPPAGAG